LGEEGVDDDGEASLLVKGGGFKKLAGEEGQLSSKII
jgi:hypothetical protein